MAQRILTLSLIGLFVVSEIDDILEKLRLLIRDSQFTDSEVDQIESKLIREIDNLRRTRTRVRTILTDPNLKLPDLDD
jgi:predicted transcriptional regulator